MGIVKKLGLVVGVFLLFVLATFVIYKFITHVGAILEARRVEVKRIQDFNSISSQFAHVRYTASDSAAISPVFYPNIPDLTKSDSTFSAQIEAIIPKSKTMHDVHITWPVLAKATAYKVYLKSLLFGLKTAGSVSDLYSVISLRKNEDYVLWVDGCTKTTCISSKKIFLSQDQPALFTLKQTSAKDFSWSTVTGVIRYNIFVRKTNIEPYTKAVASTNKTSAEITVSKNEYMTVQACNLNTCSTSNELLITSQ